MNDAEFRRALAEEVMAMKLIMEDAVEHRQDNPLAYAHGFGRVVGALTSFFDWYDKQIVG